MITSKGFVDGAIWGSFDLFFYDVGLLQSIWQVSCLI